MVELGKIKLVLRNSVTFDKNPVKCKYSKIYGGTLYEQYVFLQYDG